MDMYKRKVFAKTGNVCYNINGKNKRRPRREGAKRSEKMKEIRQERLTGERALFQGKNLAIYDTVFADGESPLKESENIGLYETLFKWKYPLWYGKHIRLENCTFADTARAGVWYTDDIAMKNCVIAAATGSSWRT